MKQELQEPKTKCQTRLDIVNAKSRKSSIHFSIPSKAGISDIFLIRNKGKGPPGRTRNPGLESCLTRDEKHLSFRAPKIEPVEGSKTLIENELITYINKSNFLSQLNFIIMKKQILFLMFFVLVSLTSITTALGQKAVPGTAPVPLAGCNDDALHPIPGKKYTYDVLGTGNAFTWWATKDPDFIKLDASTPPVPVNNLATKLTKTLGELEDHSVNYGTAADPSSKVDITWSPQILAGTALTTVGTKSPTFVVVQAEDAATCTNNLKVYQLDPVIGFTVDITNIDQLKVPTAYGTNVATCFSKVVGAKFNAGTIDYDYGTNVLYYEVVAANFTNFWTASFKVGGLQTGQTAIIEWTYDKALPAGSTGYTALPVVTGDGTVKDVTATAKVEVDDATTTTTSGVSIYLRVTVANGKFEGIALTPIVIKVNGTDAEGNEDKDNTTCLVPAAAANFEDAASQDLTPRPTITTNTTATPNLFILPTP